MDVLISLLPYVGAGLAPLGIVLLVLLDRVPGPRMDVTEKIEDFGGYRVLFGEDDVTFQARFVNEPGYGSGVAVVVTAVSAAGIGMVLLLVGSRLRHRFRRRRALDGWQ